MPESHEQSDFPTRFSFKDAEARLYKQWQDADTFRPEIAKNDQGESHMSKPAKERPEPFVIMMPPPNATGILHLGHAARIATEDTLVRYHRMLGTPSLYLPGTDHAGIATQSKVEGILLKEEGKTKHDLGREAFLQKVEEFVEQSQDTIREQVRRTGASCDWSREAYTFSEELNHSVFTVFKRMHEAGLMYRGGRSVHWDPVLQTTVADDELEYETEKAPFYTFQYGPFQIGTVRPETKFGDKYVVVHPDDERYAKWNHGDTFECEWINGTITATVIKDEAADPDTGTGAMTITPWHSAIDFEIAQRHDLDVDQIIDFEGNLLAAASEFEGRSVLKQDVAQTRADIVAKLDSKGLLVSTNDEYEHNVSVNYRGGGVIEPQVMMQWFVNVTKEFPMRYVHDKDGNQISQGIHDVNNGDKVTLKDLMLKVVESKQLEIVPARFEKTYFHWVRNLRDWCVSRQLWWGHRIPVWYPKGAYGDPEQAVVSKDNPEAMVQNQFGDMREYVQDKDTLDTWFSSMLWTFSPFGWDQNDKDPESDLNYFHPTSVLETGRDILPFWVARMILASTFARGEVPFKRTLLAGMITDKHGKKMSKSKGNGIDPIEMIDQYGADALRLSLMVGTTPGNDARLHEDKVKRYRNFATKLWNIARFMRAKFPETFAEPFDSSVIPNANTLADQWILSRLAEVRNTVETQLEDLQLGYAADALYEFTWHELADWYVELLKDDPQKDSGPVARFVLETVLKLLHPFTPFVTEELWQSLGHEDLLIIAEWPSSSALALERNADAEHAFAAISRTVEQIRSIRGTLRIDPSLNLTGFVSESSSLTQEQLAGIQRLARIEISDQQSGTTIAVGTQLHLVVEGVVDLAQETARLKQQAEATQKDMKSLEARLNNPSFMGNAPAQVVKKQKDELTKLKQELASLESQLEQLA